jgi:hypothetical protein
MASYRVLLLVQVPPHPFYTAECFAVAGEVLHHPKDLWFWARPADKITAHPLFAYTRRIKLQNNKK